MWTQHLYNKHFDWLTRQGNDWSLDLLTYVDKNFSLRWSNMARKVVRSLSWHHDPPYPKEGGVKKLTKKIFFLKWSNMARKLVRSLLWHHGPLAPSPRGGTYYIGVVKKNYEKLDEKIHSYMVWNDEKLVSSLFFTPLTPPIVSGINNMGCFIQASTTWLLFCSNVNNMAAKTEKKLARQGCVTFGEVARIFARQGYISQVSQQALPD